MGGPNAIATRYSQLRPDEASMARKTASEIAIQQTARSHTMREWVMKPGFHKGFNEADRGKDVRKGQRSGKQCTTSVRRGAAANKDNH